MQFAMGTEVDLPAGWRLDLDEPPSADTRALLGREINAFHARTVPYASDRFGVMLRDETDRLGAGVVGVVSWTWLFVEAVWVDDALRGRGVGRALMRRAEAHAAALGCHSAWLDTFQARDFYLGLGYEVFGELEAYPADQKRHFMRKSLIGALS